MSGEDYELNDEANGKEHLSLLVSYKFNAQPFDFETATELTEDDDTLSSALRLYYPELRNRPDRSLATAWRTYSQRVGLVTEEYVCVRLTRMNSGITRNSVCLPLPCRVTTSRHCLPM